MALRKVCGVCGRTLDSVTLPSGEEEYSHTLQDSPEDHPPVAVDPGSEQDRPRCDFCNEDYPEFVIPARNFQFNDIPMTGSMGGWSACTTCANLVDSGRWSELTRRAQATYERRRGPMGDLALTSLKGMYRLLRKNITGSAIPIHEYNKEN